MSSRGIMTNRLYVSVEVEFDDVWDDLDSDEQKNIVTSNIGMIDTDELGSYTNKEDAIKARLDAELKYFGKYKSQVL